MEKIKSNYFLLFWSLLAFGAMTIIWFLPWRFQVNDDEIMMWLVSGAYTGTPESYAVFIHPILSWTFSKLYTLAPAIPWYPLTWFLVIWLSFLGLILNLNLRRSRFNANIILLLFCLSLFLHFALFLQFTIVAGISGISGLLLLFRGNAKKNKSLSIFSFFLIGISILIRWESFVLVFLGFGFFYFIFYSLSGILKSLRLFLFPSLLLVILLGSKIIWEQQSEYSDFIHYNKARAAVSDHPITNQLSLEGKLKIDSKWFFFSQWMMEDESSSLSELRARKAELDAELFSFKQIGNSIVRLIRVMRTEAFKSIFSGILIAFFLFNYKDSKQALVFLLLWLLFFIVFNHFFILNGRVVILFFLPFLFPVFIEANQRLIGKRTSIILSFLIIILFTFHVLNFMNEAQARKVMQTEFITLTETIPEESLLVLEGYPENFLGINYTLDKQVPFLSLGWISKSPFQKKKLKNLHLEHISEAKEYFLLGVDVNKIFYFSEYMRFLGEDFRLESKIEEENFILYYYLKTLPASR
ncbi:hypothetical protein SAMN06265367_10352 [Algoriphagus winogradskyi]|uniref:Glycosyltransferase RgtA/B/C/D-like domain-containing protein n=2 Tax=Algoriphagus winogradskyi TaxID=237017 RepID=A0ABY1NWN0_9BACT|nr:hypothetical protein SAMN06265367_10352 [Algoriphagus winogradskyi]